MPRDVQRVRWYSLSAGRSRGQPPRPLHAGRLEARVRTGIGAHRTRWLCQRRARRGDVGHARRQRDQGACTDVGKNYCNVAEAKEAQLRLDPSGRSKFMLDNVQAPRSPAGCDRHGDDPQDPDRRRRRTKKSAPIADDVRSASAASWYASYRRSGPHTHDREAHPRACLRRASRGLPSLLSRPPPRPRS